MREEKILTYIRDELLDDDDVTIDSTTSLFEDRVLDSLNLLSLISFLEREFSTKIASSQVNIENLDTVERIIGFLDRQSTG